MLVTGVFAMFEQYPNIGRTKRLKVVPVIERFTSQAISLITQDAVMQTLLQSSGLEWFDGIANKVISEFRYIKTEHFLIGMVFLSLADS
ncbi:hypothetical protein L484_018570 [Morus notabilis]|uniref:Uncharacterized protein n=1 Tax=Morus notabilis TaxID=981085 RepID=W9QH11_9ROSA|nr:hypothetical protein L484_018570 [Morus notabilis]